MMDCFSFSSIGATNRIESYLTAHTKSLQHEASSPLAELHPAFEAVACSYLDRGLFQPVREYCIQHSQTPRHSTTRFRSLTLVAMASLCSTSMPTIKTTRPTRAVAARAALSKQACPAYKL